MCALATLQTFVWRKSRTPRKSLGAFKDVSGRWKAATGGQSREEGLAFVFILSGQLISHSDRNGLGN
jgi:hypothetical protein